MSVTTVSNAAVSTGPLPSAGEAEPPLRAYLASLLREGQPSPLPSPEKPVPIRRWPPSGNLDSIAIDFVDRHPEFWPGCPDVPMRRITRLARAAKKGWRGIFQSRKMRRPMRHHTGVELGVLKACEADIAVAAFVEHPARIRTRVGLAERTLLLSAYAERSGERWLLACRREEAASKPEN